MLDSPAPSAERLGEHENRLSHAAARVPSHHGLTLSGLGMSPCQTGRIPYLSSQEAWPGKRCGYIAAFSSVGLLGNGRDTIVMFCVVHLLLTGLEMLQWGNYPKARYGFCLLKGRVCSEGQLYCRGSAGHRLFFHVLGIVVSFVRGSCPHCFGITSLHLTV